MGDYDKIKKSHINNALTLPKTVLTLLIEDEEISEETMKDALQSLNQAILMVKTL